MGFGEEAYDARKADIWSMGIILYELALGSEPYKLPNVKDPHFYKVKHQKLMESISINGKTNYVNKKMVSLMESLLTFREHERINSCDLLCDQWTAQYYKRYKAEIEKKSKFQRI